MTEDQWTTVGVAEALGDDVWRNGGQRAFPGFEVEFDRGFSGTLRHRVTGCMQVDHLAVDASMVLRRAKVLSRCQESRLSLLRMRSGRGLMRHAGGEILLQRDECVLIDSREPFDLTLTGGADLLWYRLPVEWLERHLPDPQVVVGVPLGDRQPWAGVLRDVLDAIHENAGAASPFLLSENLGSALALTAETIEVRSTRHVRKTFISLQRTLANLAFTCNVTAGEIAQAHGISLRYLHAIYSANGTSCGRELFRLRLERARRILLDPAEHGRSIDDIAWQCGFSDASHFRRRFRTFFGVPPSALRDTGGSRSTEAVLSSHPGVD